MRISMVQEYSKRWGMAGLGGALGSGKGSRFVNNLPAEVAFTAE